MPYWTRYGSRSRGSRNFCSNGQHTLHTYLHTRQRRMRLLILDTSLDDVEGSGDDQRSRGTGDGGNEVLGPGCGIVVGKTERFFGECGASKELYRGGGTSARGT